MADARLCYVTSDGGGLFGPPGDHVWSCYFTDQPLGEQWGDDWNDVPYEHNAGTPYDHKGQQITVVRFVMPDGAGWPIQPHQQGSYAVEQINRREIPWLRTDHHVEPYAEIRAGASPADLLAFIAAIGGTVLEESSRG